MDDSPRALLNHCLTRRELGEHPTGTSRIGALPMIINEDGMGLGPVQILVDATYLLCSRHIALFHEIRRLSVSPHAQYHHRVTGRITAFGALFACTCPAEDSREFVS